jgi:hypothetical protein
MYLLVRQVHLAHGFALASPPDQICKIPPRFSPVSKCYKSSAQIAQHGSARWSCAGQLPAQSPRGEVVTAQTARGQSIFFYPPRGRASDLYSSTCVLVNLVRLGGIIENQNSDFACRHAHAWSCPGMTTHRDFAEKSKQQFEYFYSCYSLPARA